MFADAENPSCLKHMEFMSENTFQREISPLMSVHDAYPKMLIARTRHDEYQYEGIRIVDFSDRLDGVSHS